MASAIMKGEKSQFILTIGVLLLGLASFLFGVYFVNHQTVYIGRKNLFFIALLPSAILWFFRTLKQKNNIAGYKLIFYILPFLWAAGAACFFFLIAGIGTVDLWIAYLASQVCYLGGWIVIFAVLTNGADTSKRKGVILLGSVLFFLIAVNLLVDGDIFARSVTKPLLPMRLDVPQVFFEIILVAIGVALYKLSLNTDKAANILVVLSILAFILGFGLTNNGRSFWNYVSYDYMFFAPFLLGVTLAIEVIIWRLYMLSRPASST